MFNLILDMKKNDFNCYRIVSKHCPELAYLILIPNMKQKFHQKTSETVNLPYESKNETIP